MAQLVPIDSLDDPRLDPYRNVKDRDLARSGGRFVAEGEQVVRRLLASGLRTESLLVERGKLARVEPHLPADVPAFVVPEAVMTGVTGVAFHGGMLAVGVRPAGVTLESVVPADAAPATLVVCQGVANVDNLGAIVRAAAGLGVDAMLLGEQCCDPFFRHAVRVSMGTVFRLPIVRSENLAGDLIALRQRWGFEVAATVLADDAEPLDRAARGPRLAVVFGNEAQGLDAAALAACDRRVTIPMDRGTDSLNVAVAAGIFLYHFRQPGFGSRDSGVG